MKLISQGKTKDVYDNRDGTYTLKLKDSATGRDGVFDPGENKVGLNISGLGQESLKLSKYYFEKIAAADIPTHYIDSDISRATMVVKPAQIFGHGLEFICRVKADGSFIRRYGDYALFGQELKYFVEVTLKNDERLDPPITEDALYVLNIMTKDEYQTCKDFTQQITKIIKQDLEKSGLELFDIKFEFGKNNGQIILIDEVSAGCMRVYKDGKPVKPMDLSSYIRY